ncbi:MAG TPA: helix-turn-helix domain-containing protein [Gemmatimonadales bacterium]|nr:helix-turn-helix domain-containing protein [Gemmatimonadales bacterium]
MSSSDLEEHAANARGWMVDFRQLGRGRFAGTLAFAHSSDVQYGDHEWSPGLMVAGAAPRDTVTLGVWLQRAPEARLRGEPFTDADIGVLRPGDDVDLRAFGPSRLFTVSLPQSRVERYLEAVLGQPLEDLSQQQRLVTDLTPGARRQQFARIGVSHLYGQPQHLVDPGIATQLEEKVMHALCVGVRLPRQRARWSGSAALARRAEEFLAANLERPTTIRDLCVAVGATERTLHDAFRRHFNASPKAHLKLLRLNAVHRELQRGEPGTTVTGVAMRWGFFHLSWFAQDYRRMFECTPSETLRVAMAGNE